MPEISEEDVIVTKDGDIAEVDRIYNDHRKSVFCEGVVKAKRENVVRVDQPIGVRVDRSSEVEQLIKLAKKCGFEYPGYKKPDYFKYDYVVLTDEKTWHLTDTGESHQTITYEDDYKQIKKWLQFHRESEDDCETCGGKGEYLWMKDHMRKWLDCPDCTDESEGDECEQANFTQEAFEKIAESATEELRAQKGLCIKCGQNEASKPDWICPDCTDESEKPDEMMPSPLTMHETSESDVQFESKELITDDNIDSDNPDELLDEPRESEGYSEPRPNDEEFREWWRANNKPKKEFEVCDDLKWLVYSCFDYIEDLESELEDVREELSCWKEKAGKRTGQRDNLKERIEEARDYLEEWDKRLHDRFGDLVRLKEILS